MRRLILILAISLISSPAFAMLDVYLEREGITNVVDVKYSGADPANLPSTFALVVKTNCQALIDDVNNFKLNGESTATSQGYGIYPARITIGTDGTVVSYGSPLADSADPGPAGTGIDTNSVVLEFGSLYSGDVNAPATSGTLCKLYINLNGSTTNFIMTMVDEATYRGGVILEDGTKVEVDSALILGCFCAPGAATNPSPTNGTTGVSRAGVSLTWTAGGTPPISHDVYFGTSNPPPFKVNQTATSYATGAMLQGRLYYWQIVERNYAGTNAGPIWSFRVEECMKSTAAEYSTWVIWDRPDCWCCKRQCRGDADCIKTGLYWVSLSDLNLLKACFGKNDTTLRTIPNGICADFDHTKTGLYRVSLPDLNILKTWFNKTNVPCCDLDSDCILTAADKYNFWTN